MKKKNLTLAFLALLVVGVVLNSIGVLKVTMAVKSTPDAPPAVYTPVAVRIINDVNGVKYAGYGVAVSHQGAEFIATSSLMTYAGVGTITVDGEPVQILAKDDKSCVMALESRGLRPVPLTECDWGTMMAVYAGETPTVVNKICDSGTWAIVETVPANFTGAPIFEGDGLVGIIIGANRSQPLEALAAGTDSLIQLAEEIK